MAEPAPDERRRQVLVAVVREHIDTAEPVGSRSVAKHSDLGLSPATIRNTMADLEEMGYLTQPHTSAGRVPTDKAYRFYVDTFSEQRGYSEPLPTRPLTHSTRSQTVVEQMMEQASLDLSSSSRMTALLLAPPLKQARLGRLELTALPRDHALAVVVTEQGWVTTRTLTLDQRVTPEELREVGRQLTRRFQGKTFQEIVDEVAAPPDPLDPLHARTGSLVQQVFSLLRDRTLYIGGAINILEHPEFWPLSTMRVIFRTFEEKGRLVDLLSELANETGIQVMIGRENPFEEMQECSLVTSTYTYDDQVMGILGVVGPKRMQYGRLIPLVAETANYVSQSLTRYRQLLYIPS
ncbi:MAG: heat-inducible transcriptional repressor HrcA [Candidatus Methylomirabilia bacterium]